MSSNLILIITIFVFWLFTYLTNVKEEQKKQAEQSGKIADDDVQRTSTITNPVNGESIPTKNGIPDLPNINKKQYITSPVKAKGEL